MSRKSGQHYEQLAAGYLLQQGLKTLQGNFHCRAGEIDLICLEHNSLVFVEVKFRKNSHFGSALEMVSFRKQQKLIKTALFFLQRYPRYQSLPCRFDVVAITGQCHGQPKIDWIKNAIPFNAVF